MPALLVVLVALTAVGAPATGGKIKVFGVHDIDQRDDPAFAVFASAARYPVTPYDVRPLTGPSPDRP